MQHLGRVVSSFPWIVLDSEKLGKGMLDCKVSRLGPYQQLRPASRLPLCSLQCPSHRAPWGFTTRVHVSRDLICPQSNPTRSHQEDNVFRAPRRGCIRNKWRAGQQLSRCQAVQIAEEQTSIDAEEQLAIEVSDLTFSFGSKEVLRGANLAVPRGSLHILAGANGCGKSTLLRILGGLLQPQGGCFFIDRPRGVVLQNPDHQIVMPTVAAEVAFGLGRYKLPKQAVASLVEDALRAVDMQDYNDRATNTLSGGQKQRVAIAGALAQNPKVLLLDELTTFLDDAGQRSVMEAVRKAVTGPRRVTALWVTHRLEELDWADGASFIEDGRVTVSGSPNDVRRHLKQLGAHFQ